MMQAIILAAGKGTRMKSELPKVLQQLQGKPMLAYILDTMTGIGISEPVVVVGHEKEMVMELIHHVCPSAQVAIQESAQGTGDAVKVALSLIKDDAPVCIVMGDHPFWRGSTLEALLAEHVRTGSTLSMVTAIPEDPKRYGRVIRGADGKICKIVEFKGATEEEIAVKEVNMACYVVDPVWLKQAILRLTPNETTGEYYLTDIIGFACDAGLPVASITIDDMREAVGIDTPEQLQEAEEWLATR